MVPASLGAAALSARPPLLLSKRQSRQASVQARVGLAAAPPRRAAAPPQRAAVAAAAAATQVEGMTMAAFQDLLASSATEGVLVDFCTEWCGPCKVLSKNMKAVAPAWRDRVTFHKIDTEKNAEVAGAFNIHKLPTLILFRGGQQVDRHEGLLSGQDLDLRLRKLMR